jgi:tRNA1(Val) A37 N6-methylase TrmN6
MTIAKRHRVSKRQYGQFLTPASVARAIVDRVELRPDSRILEPSFGEGAFIIPLLERLVNVHGGSASDRLVETLSVNLYGVELDKEMYRRCLERITARFGPPPCGHNLVQADFFRHDFTDEFRLGPDGPRDQLQFDLIIGNPPFGGTFGADIEDKLDRAFGNRYGYKIKKETYAFFIVKSVELLRANGRLVFICSDSLLTIPTMRGLRAFLMNQGDVRIQHLPEFSRETNYPMVVLDFRRSGRSEGIIRDGRPIVRTTIEMSQNLSWGMTDGLCRVFDGPTVGHYMVGTSGMTVGRNEYFVRRIRNGRIEEPYEFEFFEEPITLAGEIARARLGKLSPRQQEEVLRQERQGETRRCVRAHRRDRPIVLELPHPDYKPYNKSNGKIVYSPPDHVIYWRNSGEAVLTFKKAGNWYLRGVGGQPFFEREGLTWQLVASRFKARYLPSGYILDSGAPCGFLRDGVAADELWFVLAWMQSRLCSEILKSVINHTINIQSKDFERTPYPHWVSVSKKEEAVARIRALVNSARRGRSYSPRCREIAELSALFDLSEEE